MMTGRWPGDLNQAQAVEERAGKLAVLAPG